MDYMMSLGNIADNIHVDNNIELIALAIAFCFSYYKKLPIMIIAYNFVMQVMAFYDQSRKASAIRLFHAGYYDMAQYLDKYAIIFISDAMIMILCGLCFFFIIGRLPKLCAFVIMAQAMVSLAMVPAVYNEKLDFMFGVHSFLQSVFVVAYIVIAWNCIAEVRTIRYGNQR